MSNNTTLIYQRMARWALLLGIFGLPAVASSAIAAQQLLVKTSELGEGFGKHMPHEECKKLKRSGEQSGGWQLWGLEPNSDAQIVAEHLNLEHGAGQFVAELNQQRQPMLYGLPRAPKASPDNPNSAVLNQLRLPEAWRITTGSEDVVIAVIDDGIDLQHAGLKDKLWRNPKEVANDRVDNDRNGFVDDIHGWNFREGNNSPHHRGNEPGHGTLVAGAISGEHIANGKRLPIGSAPDARIMALRINHDSFSLLQALRYAADNGADIINISLGGVLPSQAEREAIKELGAQGILVVAAAGNHHNNNDFRGIFPASYDAANLISVGALDSNERITSWSQYGSTTVDLVAPGVAALTTNAANAEPYVTVNGSSLATGYVSGVAALVKSAFPHSDAAAIRARLLSATYPLESSFVTATDGAADASAALASKPISTPLIKDYSITKASLGQREVSIELEYLTADSPAAPVVDSQLSCTSHPSSQPLATEPLSADALFLRYRITLGQSAAANLRCKLQLTDDMGTTHYRPFRFVEERYLPLNTVANATLQTEDFDDYQHWVVDVPVGSQTLNVSVHSSFNVDLLLRHDQAPRYVASLGNGGSSQALLVTDNDTIVSAGASGFETITLAQPSAGRWHVVVLNQQQQRNTTYSLKADIGDGNDGSIAAANAAVTQSAPLSSSGGGSAGLLIGLTLLLRRREQSRKA